jgi:hypothetical protein
MLLVRLSICWEVRSQYSEHVAVNTADRSPEERSLAFVSIVAV